MSSALLIEARTLAAPRRQSTRPARSRLPPPRPSVCGNANDARPIDGPTYTRTNVSRETSRDLHCPPPTTRRDSRRAITTGMRLRPVRCDDRSATRTDLSWRPERDDAAFPERARKRLGSISTSPPSPSLFPVPNESTLRRKPCVQMFHVKHPGSAAPLRGFVAKSIRNRYLGYTSSERTARGCAQFRAETELP